MSMLTIAMWIKTVLRLTRVDISIFKAHFVKSASNLKENSISFSTKEHNEKGKLE